MSEQINNYEKGEMLNAFPIHDFVRMLRNIDRFDTEVPDAAKTKTDAIMEKAEEVSEKIIETGV